MPNQRLAGQNTKVFLEHKLRRKDGTDIYALCYGRVYYDSAVRAERSEIITTNMATTHSVKMLMKTSGASPEQNG